MTRPAPMADGTLAALAAQDALTPERLAAWLDAKEPRQRCGDRGNPWNCPIANYLRDVTGASSVVITGTVIADRENFRLPDWGRVFINLVDNDRESYEIPAGRASKALAAALRARDAGGTT